MTTTSQEVTKNAKAPIRKKITAEIIKMADKKAGETITGKFLEQTQREWFDDKDGETKMIPVFHFENIQTKERFNVFGDAGLVNAMNGASVKPNMIIEIEKQAKKDIGGGRSVNSYEIYELN